MVQSALPAVQQGFGDPVPGAFPPRTVSVQKIRRAGMCSELRRCDPGLREFAATDFRVCNYGQASFLPHAISQREFFQRLPVPC
jgi:hypothetical protein